MTTESQVVKIYATKRIKTGYDVEKKAETFTYDEHNVNDVAMNLYRYDAQMDPVEPLFLLAVGARNISMLLRLSSHCILENVQLKYDYSREDSTFKSWMITAEVQRSSVKLPEIRR